MCFLLWKKIYHTIFIYENCMISIFSDQNFSYVFDCQNAFYIRYNQSNLFKVTQTCFLVIFEKKLWHEKWLSYNFRKLQKRQVDQINRKLQKRQNCSFKFLKQFLNFVWILYDKHFFHRLHLWNFMTSVFLLWTSTRVASEVQKHTDTKICTKPKHSLAS